MNNIQYAASLVKDMKNSHLQAFATRVTSILEIQLAYMRIRQLYQYADHILLAYRIQTSQTEFKQGCTSDRQDVGDHEVLKALKAYTVLNAAVFVTWEYGGMAPDSIPSAPLLPQHYKL